MYAVVLILQPSSAKELILTYAIREGQVCLPGMLFSVVVRGKQEEGLVLRLQKTFSGAFSLLELGEALIPYQMVTRRGLALARWLARYYVCPLHRAATLFLPPAVRPSQEIRYHSQAPILFADPLWQPLWDAVEKSGVKGMSHAGIIRRWGRQGAAQADTWAKAGYLRKTTEFRQGHRAPRKEALADLMSANPDVVLSSEQQAVFDTVSKDIKNGKAGKHLLFGVTGSGKTEVYLQLASFAGKQGKRTIYLVPEISLVPQLVAKAEHLFPGRVAILHSNLTTSQRNAEWQRIRDGEVMLVIGPRSALFAPVDHLGLIVIDEEHEHTYKQGEPEPRYDARKTAEILARLWKATVIRGSATPDIETIYRTEKGEIALSTMPNRIMERPMPTVEWINMNIEMQEGHPYPVSRRLLEALQDRKRKGEQAILLLNRRGYHNYVLCRDCGKTIECPHCSIPLTYHRHTGAEKIGTPALKNNERHWLACHYCGYQSVMWAACPRCGSTMLQYMGTGTQRVIDYLKKEIPSLSLLRLDMDSTAKAGSHNAILKAFQEGTADVLVGTQMVAKGFDFPKVTLSAVLHIDGIMNLPDFQGSERAFQLIVQTAGRAGRDRLPGEVMVQTFNPDNPVLRRAGAYDMASFFQNELELRRLMAYPPLRKCARIIVTGPKDETVAAGLEELVSYCRLHMEAKETEAVTWLGPAKAPVEKINNRWRWHLILLADSWAPLAHCLRLARAKSLSWGTWPRLILDMEPKSFM